MGNTNSTVKLTSKHQLTLPIKVVPQLQLSAGDSLLYELKDGALTLKPRPTLHQQLKSIWTDNAKLNKGAASNASIKQTLEIYYRNKKS